MEWLEKLQAPGLILAGVVIWWLFRLVQDRDRELVRELKTHNELLMKLATLMDLICRRAIKSGEADGGK
jgi:hypothetical protein